MIINGLAVHAELHHAWEVNMNHIRKDVLKLVTLNETIQSAVLTGELFTDDEVKLIYQCARELLEKVPPSSGFGAKADVGGDGAPLNKTIGGP